MLKIRCFPAAGKRATFVVAAFVVLCAGFFIFPSERTSAQVQAPEAAGPIGLPTPHLLKVLKETPGPNREGAADASRFTGTVKIGGATAATRSALQIAKLDLIISNEGALIELLRLTRQDRNTWRFGMTTDQGLYLFPVNQVSAENPDFHIANSSGAPFATFSPDTGYVGIGTPTPAQRLVVGAGVTSEAITVNAGNGWADLNLNSTTAAGGGGNIYWNNNGTNFIDILGYGNNGSPYLSLSFSGSEKVRFTNTGNVGIGTTTPASNAKLDINGKARASDFVASRFNLRTDLVDDLANDAPWYGVGTSSLKLPGTTIDGGRAVQLGGYFGLNLQTGGGQLVINQQGNVGIGANNPGLKLSVADGWIGSEGNWNTTGGFRFGRWPAYDYGNNWVYLSRANSTAYADLAIGQLYQSSGLAYFGGNVGIGTTSPESGTKLDVRGNVRIGDGSSPEQDILFRSNNGQWQVGSNDAGNGTSKNQFYIYDTAYRFTVQKDTGNVGIGTASPGTKLEVSSDAENTPIWIRNTSAGGDFWSVESIGNVPGRAGNFEINRPGSMFGLAITKTGNVGIGIPDPKYKLHVKANSGGTSSGALLTLQPQSNVGAAVGDKFGLRFTADNTDRLAGIYAVSESADWNQVGLAFWLSGQGIAEREIMRIQSQTGNVGIGTTSPGNGWNLGGNLQVNGTIVRSGAIDWNEWISANGVTENPNGGGVGLKFQHGNNSDYDKGKWAGIAGVAESTWSNSVGLSLYTSGSNSEKMRITSGGNVGIGTTEPQQELQFAKASYIGLPSNGGAHIPTSWRRGNAGGIIFAGSENSDGTGWAYGSRMVNHDYGDGLGLSFDVLKSGVWKNDALFISGRGGNVGNVGIGTPSPARKLHISGVAGSGNEFLMESTNMTANQKRFNIYLSDNKTFFRTLNDAGNGGRDWLTVDNSNGSVGIGATSPGYKLQVAGGSISIDRDQALRAAGNWLIGQSASNNLIGIGSTNVANDIRFDSSTAAGLMTVKADGNVLIGKGYSDGGITLGKDGTLQVGKDIILKGDLYRENLQELNVKNNTIILNAGARVAQDAFIKVRDANNPDGQMKWNQTGSQWEISPKLQVVGSFDVNGSIITNGQIYLTGTGTGTYNKAAIYNDLSNNFLVERARKTDSVSGEITDFIISQRGTGNAAGAPFIVKGSGNVGIGTIDPTPTLTGARLLQIDDDTDAVLGFRSTLAGTNRPDIRFSVGALSNGGYDRAVLTTESNHDLALYTNSALRAAILASGEFQVGTATVYDPSAKLLVHKEAEETTGSKSDVFKVQRGYGPKDGSRILADLAVDTRGVVAVGGDAPTNTDAKLFVKGKTIAANFCIRKDGTDTCVADWNSVTPWSVNGGDIYYNRGKVGIGTSDPKGKLHVYGGDFSVEQSGGNGNKIFFTNDHAAHYLAADNYWIDVVGNSREVFRVWKGEKTDANNEVFRITGGGKTLIKSTDAGAGQLQIGNPNNNGEASMAFISGATGYGVPTSVNGNKNIWVMGANIWGIGGDKFGIGNMETSGPLMTLQQSNGNVGIGTTSPNAKLEVVSQSQDALRITGNETSRTWRFGFGSDGNLLTESPWDRWKIYLDDNNDAPLDSFEIYHNGTASGSPSQVFGTYDDKVGIGATDPKAKLHILNESQDANGNSLILGPIDSSNLRLGYHQDYSWIQSHGSKPLAINPVGNRVGIGTTNPQAKLHVVDGDVWLPRLITTGDNTANYNDPLRADIVVGSNVGSEVVNGNGGVRHNSSIMFWSNESASRLANKEDVFYGSVWNAHPFLGADFALGLGGHDSYLNSKGGGVTIGSNNTPCPQCKLDVRGGDINVALNGNQRFADLPASTKLALETDRIGLDVAELFESEEEVEVGDVVVVADSNRKLKKSSAQYQGTIVGVVSGAPALLFEGSQLKLGSNPERFSRGAKPPVALAGRIPVKVSLENGAIKPGDYLTSSSKPGIAMKATEPGMTIGVALEEYNEKTEGGSVLVFLNLDEKSTNVLMTKLDSLERRLRALEYKPRW